MVGVQSGVTTLVDQGGPSCMTLPGFRHFIAEKAAVARLAFLSAYLVGGLEGHYYPNLYSPDGVDIDATVQAATANRDLVRGIKAHAEIGGFARWGIRVIEMAAEIGRRADLPVYVHFGQLWGLPESGANGEDVDTILDARDPAAAAGRRAGASVHAPSRRLRQPRGRGASGDPGGARPRPEDRRRPRQPLLLPAGAQGARRRHRADHAGRRHARLQHPRAGAGRHAGRACRRREPSVRRPGEIQPGAGDELDDGARPDARAGRADGDLAIRPRCSACPDEIGALKPGMRRRRRRCSTTSAAASFCATTRRPRSSPTACCSRRSACAPA